MSAAELRAAVLDFAGRVARCPGAHTLIECPCCGARTINDLSAEFEPGFGNCSTGGISLNILCGNGHRWQLRISNWYMDSEYAELTKKKFQQRMALDEGPAPKVVAIKPRMRSGKKLPDRITWRNASLDFGDAHNVL